MYAVYSVELDIMVTGEPSDSFTNVIHVTNSGQNQAAPGDRMPLISIRPDENKLHIGSYVNGEINHVFNSNEELKLNIWTNVRVQQTITNGKYIYAIYMDNHQKYVIPNKTPIDLYDLKVYASSPWSSAPNAKIRNFKFTTCKAIVYSSVSSSNSYFNMLIFC